MAASVEGCRSARFDELKGGGSSTSQAAGVHELTSRDMCALTCRATHALFFPWGKVRKPPLKTALLAELRKTLLIPDRNENFEDLHGAVELCHGFL